MPFGDDRNIQVLIARNQFSTEKFPEPPFQSIPADGIPDFPAHRNSEPSPTQVIGTKQNGKMGCLDTPPDLPGVLVIPGSAHPPGSRETPIHCRPDNYLLGIATASCLRPRARRRLITLLPLRLRIRLRNPWVRFRLTRLG